MINFKLLSYNSHMSALLRWVGSKQWARQDIAELVRGNLSDNGMYYEPFAGSAAVLFTLRELKKACICDTVEPLIRAYKAIKDEPMEVHRWATKLAKNESQQAYYSNRDLFNDYLMLRKPLKTEYELAGLFIYLNSYCFNGLWRQNLDGEFNVPKSDREKAKIPKSRSFILASQILQHTRIMLIEPPSDIFDVIDASHKGDVVFADPPYYETFDNYDGLEETGPGFHERLATTLQCARNRGVKIIAMNSDTKLVHRVYKEWCHIKTIERHQTVASTNEGRGEWTQVLAVSK